MEASQSSKTARTLTRRPKIQRQAHTAHASSSAPVDVTRDVISAMLALAYVSIQSFANVSTMSSCWRHPLTIDHIDFDRWLLTVDRVVDFDY